MSGADEKNGPTIAFGPVTEEMRANRQLPDIEVSLPLVPGAFVTTPVPDEKRTERWLALIAEHDPTNVREDLGLLKSPSRFALVQRSRFCDETFAQTFDTEEAALEYEADDGTEYSDDWEGVHLVDLDTGRSATLISKCVVTATWEQ